ncbi:MAG TPA: urea carboxylase-associated family protein [Sphingomonas sp.]|nr:urea carboxylase-associated family protein [Sphingomonas sp.]
MTPDPSRDAAADVATHEIEPRSGAGFELAAGQRLTVIDPRGEQVADLLAFALGDIDEVISSGRTFDYANRIYLTTGDLLYSNRSKPMLEIVHDDVGRHDFLLTPCSADTFRIIYGDEHPHRGCFGNLAAALSPWGVRPDRIPVAFNCFMNVPVDGATGAFTVEPPLSKAGDRIVFEARMDLVIGLTACSALQSNNGSFKPIHYRID